MFESSEVEERECIQIDPNETQGSTCASSRISLRFNAASPKWEVGTSLS
jgi:hypothetical protein